jgi:energy-coupling factor transporter ATP-binding protein EcfA2
VALIGPAGAGKSTLLHFCNGLLRPRQPGRVSVLGRDLSGDVDLAALRRDVGLVFQYPHHQLFERFVGDDVAYGPRQMRLDEDEVEARVHWALEAVALDPSLFADRPTLSLSGGEMRRAAIAGVLATRPRVLVLDEVTTGLDPEGRRQLHALLRRLNRDEGVTLLFVSNDLDEVAELADEVAVLYQWCTVAQGSTRQVLADPPLLERYGLAAPFAPGLALALRGRGLALRRTPLTPAEAEEELWLAWKG